MSNIICNISIDHFYGPWPEGTPNSSILGYPHLWKPPHGVRPNTRCLARWLGLTLVGSRFEAVSRRSPRNGDGRSGQFHLQKRKGDPPYSNHNENSNNTNNNHPQELQDRGADDATTSNAFASWCRRGGSRRGS